MEERYELTTELRPGFARHLRDKQTHTDPIACPSDAPRRSLSTTLLLGRGGPHAISDFDFQSHHQKLGYQPRHEKLGQHNVPTHLKKFDCSGLSAAAGGRKPEDMESEEEDDDGFGADSFPPQTPTPGNRRQDSTGGALAKPRQRATVSFNNMEQVRVIDDDECKVVSPPKRSREADNDPAGQFESLFASVPTHDFMLLDDVPMLSSSLALQSNRGKHGSL